jgi:tetratricopeptide (TPR) repeat protein
MRLRPSTKNRAAAALAGLAFLAALAIPAELWARRKWPPKTGIVGSTPEFDYFHLQIHDDFFKLERYFGLIPYRYRTQRERSGLQYFGFLKKPDTLRVFVIGGSVAMGFNAHEQSRLGEFLERSLPGKKFEIVGCGMGGYDSYRDSLVEEEALRHDPDLIVVLSGNNEYAPALRLNPALYRVNRLLRESRLYQRLQDSYQSGLREKPWPLDGRLRTFEENLRLMIARAERRKVPVILCTLPVNIRDIAPTFSPPPTDDAAYFRARVALDRGRNREAAQGFQAYTAAHPREPFGYYWLGKSLDLDGSGEEARRAYLNAVEWDDPGSRCAPRRNAVIRALAREPGAAVADVDKVFAGLVPHGLTDSRLFKDDVHWYDEYYPLVALTIVQAAAEYDRTHEKPMLAPAGEWNRWWDPSFERELSHPAMSEERRLRYAEEVFISGVSKIFQSEGFFESGVAYFLMAERLRPGTIKRFLASPGLLQAKSDASPWLEHVRYRLKSEWPRVLTHGAEACRRLGRLAEARAYLDESIRLSPGDPYARLTRSLLERSAGKRDEAAADLRRAAGSDEPGVALWAAALK